MTNVQLTIPEGFGRAAEKLADTIRHVVDLSAGPDRIRAKVEAEALAQARAMVIVAEGRAKVQDIETRAVERVLRREVRRQNNIESIVNKALPALPPAEMVSEEPVGQDWISLFFEGCQDISNEQMQQIWARILAGEVARPGRFAPRTLRLVHDLTTTDANLFASLCNFTWDTPGSGILISKGIFATILDRDAPYILQAGLNFDALTHLSSIGLIEFNPTDEMFLENLGPEFSLSYCGHLHKLKPNEAGLVLPIGHVLLTVAGKELGAIAVRERNDQFAKAILDEWRARGWHEA
jgi:hypothetical protein